MDFIMSLPSSTHGYDAIYTVVDRFSKYVTFIPCHSTLTAEDAAMLFFEHVVCVHGMPAKVVSDRDSRFLSRFWRSLMGLFDCKLNLSSAYHP